MSMPWNPAAPPPPGEAFWQQSGWADPRDTSRAWWGGRDAYGTDWSGLTHDQRVYGRYNAATPDWVGDVNQSYRWFEPDVRGFYEDNPQQAYQQFLGWGFGDRERPLQQYARGYYGRAYADAMAAQEGQTALAAGQIAPPSGQPARPGQGGNWVDYLSPDLVYQIRQSFTMQSASNRGVTNVYMPSGRMTG